MEGMSSISPSRAFCVVLTFGIMLMFHIVKDYNKINKYERGEKHVEVMSGKVSGKCAAVVGDSPRRNE